MQMIVVESPTMAEFAIGVRKLPSDSSRTYESTVSNDGDRSGVPPCSALDG